MFADFLITIALRSCVFIVRCAMPGYVHRMVIDGTDV